MLGIFKPLVNLCDFCYSMNHIYDSLLLAEEGKFRSLSYGRCIERDLIEITKIFLSLSIAILILFDANSFSHVDTLIKVNIPRVEHAGASVRSSLY